MARVRWGAMQHSSLWLLFGFVALLSNLRTLRMAEIAVVTSSSLLSTTAFDDSPETWEHQNATIHTLSFFPSTAGVVQLDQHPLGVKSSNENNPIPKEEEENEDGGRNDNKPLLLLLLQWSWLGREERSCREELSSPTHSILLLLRSLS